MIDLTKIRVGTILYPAKDIGCLKYNQPHTVQQHAQSGQLYVHCDQGTHYLTHCSKEFSLTPWSPANSLEEACAAFWDCEADPQGAWETLSEDYKKVVRRRMQAAMKVIGGLML